MRLGCSRKLRLEDVWVRFAKLLEVLSTCLQDKSIGGNDIVHGAR